MGHKHKFRKDTRRRSTDSGWVSTESRPGGQLRRKARLGGVCLLVAATVVLVLAYLQPVDDTAPLGPWKMPHLPEPTIELPVVAVHLSNEELKEEAVGEAEALLARFPQDAECLHAAALLFAGLHQTQRAEGLWRRGIELDSRPADPRVGLAIVLSERGNDAEAADILSELLAEGHSTALIYHQLGTALTKLGKLESAEEGTQEGVRAFPAAVANWQLLGQIQYQLQKYAEAESSLRRAIELDDRSPTAWFNLANACMRQGDKDGADKARQRFAAMKATTVSEMDQEKFDDEYKRGLIPKVINSFSSFGSLYFRRERPDEGERLILRALAITPENEDSLEELASNYSRLGREADSYLVYQRLAKLDPKNVSHLFNLGTVARKVGDLPSAEAAMIDVIALEPDFAEPCLVLAQICAEKGDLDAARSWAERGIEKEPSVKGYRILALTCETLGDEERAVAAKEMLRRLTAEAAVPEG